MPRTFQGLHKISAHAPADSRHFASSFPGFCSFFPAVSQRFPGRRVIFACRFPGGRGSTLRARRKNFLSHFGLLPKKGALPEHTLRFASRYVGSSCRESSFFLFLCPRLQVARLFSTNGLLPVRVISELYNNAISSFTTLQQISVCNCTLRRASRSVRSTWSGRYRKVNLNAH